MEKRIIFNSTEVRNLFFQKVLERYNLKDWNNLKELLKISRCSLSNYRNGRLTLPENIYTKLILKFKGNDRVFFSKNISFLNNDWGRVKAGKVTYSRHKNIFDKGRNKAIEIIRKKVHRFDINLPLNYELSYFIGLFIGDGFTNRYNRYYITQLTGDKRFERDFYYGLITDYSKHLFDLIPVIHKGKNTNALRFNLYSKDLFSLITERFKIAAGRKSKTVLIPQEILNSNSNIIKACIRGLYDAEGCIFFDKREPYKKPYVRIVLHMNNLLILRQVSELLKSFGIYCTFSKIKDNLALTIYGEEQVKKFFKEIGFSNPKHLKKLKGLMD